MAGRTDPAAITLWDQILTEMHLSHDPDLKGAVQALRAMNLYDNESWIDLVNLGYGYLGDSESARHFRSALARQRPDSKWAVQAAIQKWESLHQPGNTSQAGFIEWGVARVEFLKRLHEAKPNSEAATREYLEAGLAYETHLSTDEALTLADLALRTKDTANWLSSGDPQFQVAELYIHHRARLEEAPGLLNEAVEKIQHDIRKALATERAESANREIVWAQLRAHGDLAEYWLQKNDIQQAQIAARRAGADLTHLAPAADAPRNQRELYEAEEKHWSKIAERVGIERAALFQPQPVDWTKVARVPLSDFQESDLTGRRWTLRDWRGRVVLVNMWATWCTPCRAELPYIQKLHDAFGGRTDRLVISVDVDSDTELARRLVREHGYTFPVLNSRHLADLIDFENGVPQNRIVDAQGRLLVEPVEGTGDAWVEKVKILMDEVK